MDRKLPSKLKLKILLVMLIIVNQPINHAFAETCQLIAERCVQGAETRDIGAFKVYAPCWKYEKSMSCTTPSKNNCASLRNKGCTQIGSPNCLAHLYGHCSNWHYDYNCARKEKYIRWEERVKRTERKVTKLETRHKMTPKMLEANGYLSCRGEINCLDGECFDQKYESNDELFTAISQLGALNEMAKTMVANPVTVFKGDAMQCDESIWNFIDCCGDGKGWGKNLHLTSCKPAEKTLREKRDKKLCHEIEGEFCSYKIGKILPWCGTYTRSFCCFGSKLVKNLQEQARKQLIAKGLPNIDWGTPKHPNCRGLTAEELVQIDFSQMDLSEVFDEIIANYKVPNPAAISEQIKNDMEHMQHKFGEEKNDDQIKKLVKEQGEATGVTTKFKGKPL